MGSIRNERKCYLGDGLYASFDGDQIRLAANDFDDPTDTVWLDQRTLGMFLRWIADVGLVSGDQPGT